MNRYKVFAYIIIIAEMMLFLLCNGLYLHLNKSDANREYRVEASRVARELEEASPDKINLAQYHTIISVDVYHPKEICNEDYVIYEVNDTLYRITYRTNADNRISVYINISMIAMIVCTIVILVFVWRKMICPFHSMSHLAYELAKGNLSIPIQEEKSRLFGRFLWGMDMLREKLEADRQKELEFQKEKKTLMLSLSHDIRTPLAAIDLYIRALSTNLYETEEKKAAAIAGITKNLDEIKHYVNKITTASREDFLHLEVCSEEFYLSEILRDIITYYKEKLQLLHTVFLIPTFDDCLLKGDKDRLIEVLQNIMENAIKYGDGKEIAISLSTEEDCQLIHIKNTGNTLDEKELQNIFDSFYRGSNSKNIKGSGLGLYISKCLIKKTNGDIFAGIQDKSFCVTVVIRKV